MSLNFFILIAKEPRAREKIGASADPVFCSTPRQGLQQKLMEMDVVAGASAENPEIRRFSGAFLVSADRTLILQLRDAHASIDNPSRISTFGGSAEPGEGPVECLLRELYEELGLTIDPAVLFRLGVTHKVENGVRTDCDFYLLHPVDSTGLTVTEGHLIELSLDDAFNDERLTPTCRSMLARLSEHALFG